MTPEFFALSLAGYTSQKAGQRLYNLAGSWEAVFEMGDKEIGAFIKRHNPRRTWEGKEELLAKGRKHLEIADSAGLKYTGLQDDDYPAELVHIHNPPPFLFYRGDFSILNRRWRFGIVGTRKVSPAAAGFARSLGAELAKAEALVVSGLAYGADTEAHTGAVEEGVTAAVLGTGADVIYPARNTQLAEKILKKGGLILSEFLPGTEPFKGNFPVRNRIISGLSQGVMMVQAGERSGALLTVNYGLEQGKDIYTYKPQVAGDEYQGNLKLIAQGARAAGTVQEFFTLTGINREDEPAHPRNELDEKIFISLKEAPKTAMELALEGVAATDTIWAELMKLSSQGELAELPGGRYSLI